MAYMNQELKKSFVPAIKEILKKYDMKGSLSVRDHSTIVLKLTEGKLDFGSETYQQVNVYHVDRFYDGRNRDFLNKVLKVLNNKNWDNSDISTDYFNKGYYVSINIGAWDKPYVCNK
jgi:hypothetical protein